MSVTSPKLRGSHTHLFLLVFKSDLPLVYDSDVPIVHDRDSPLVQQTTSLFMSDLLLINKNEFPWPAKCDFRLVY